MSDDPISLYRYRRPSSGRVSVLQAIIDSADICGNPTLVTYYLRFIAWQDICTKFLKCRKTRYWRPAKLSSKCCKHAPPLPLRHRAATAKAVVSAVDAESATFFRRGTMNVRRNHHTLLQLSWPAKSIFVIGGNGGILPTDRPDQWMRWWGPRPVPDRWWG